MWAGEIAIDFSWLPSKFEYVSSLVFQLSRPNPSKPGVQSRMKMQLEQRRQAMPLMLLYQNQIINEMHRDVLIFL